MWHHPLNDKRMFVLKHFLCYLNLSNLNRIEPYGDRGEGEREKREKEEEKEREREKMRSTECLNGRDENSDKDGRRIDQRIRATTDKKSRTGAVWCMSICRYHEVVQCNTMVNMCTIERTWSKQT